VKDGHLGLDGEEEALTCKKQFTGQHLVTTSNSLLFNRGFNLIKKKLKNLKKAARICFCIKTSHYYAERIISEF
jgi:hypothetical protein